MGTNQSRSQGFTLIASLLLLLLLSGIAVGLMYMTNTEVRVGGNDLENNLAFYGAEAGMEKMTSDLGNLYSGNQAPSVAAITALSGFPPTNVPGVNYTEYNFNVPVDAQGKPVTNINNIKSGPNQGLVAEIIPMTLSVSATRLSGAQVRMQRSVEVALIPVFQSGVFSQSDLSYFPGPFFDFAGRVHTNGHLFLAESDSNGLVFHSKLTAAGEVIRDKLSNGVDVVGDGRNGPVYAPNTAGGCDVAHPALHCINLAPNQGSYIGGPPPVGNPNNAWVGISTGTYAGWILNGKTGAVALNLPFVGPGVGPIEIIRKPPAGEVAGSNLSVSRLYNKAQIRVLLADTPTLLHPDSPGPMADGEDVQLNLEAGTTYPLGVPVTGMPGGGNTFFAYASTAIANGPYYDPAAEQHVPTKYAPLINRWPLVDGWLRVEIKQANGVWLGVTNEWLRLGFARGLNPPASAPAVPGGAQVHPNAILMFQMLADRDANGAIPGAPANIKESVSPTVSRYNWYPINFYDAREGEIRDVASASCAPNGVMNAIELDVGNLRRWLTGAIGANGTLTDNQTLNGYLLYFSDRRGMQVNPNVVPPAVTGEYGFEDTINAGVAAGTPDGVLDPTNPALKPPQSPEDVDFNLKADNWGAASVGDAFGVNTNGNPYTNRIACMTLGRKNQVTGARHALKLVDGSLGKLPTRPDGTGGFTVASENPVYVLGNYNANAAGFGGGNAAAAVIADTVTLLSNSWSDVNSFANPTLVNNRNATDTWYRLAIATGKNVSFPKPAWAAASDYGTDGGVHNFLRYLEDWGGGPTLWYDGSMVSLFYSQYETGVFKCCNTVYQPPTRKYAFDVLFLNPNNLPPGTPQFQDVNNVSYRQDFTPY